MPRVVDAVLNSNVFWGVVFLSLLLFGSKREGAVRIIAFALSWLAGCYWSYRWWGENTVQDWRLFGSSVLVYTGILLFLYSWTDPRRPMSRVINNEPIRAGKLVTSISALNVGAASPISVPIPNPPDWREPQSSIHLVFQDSPLLTEAVQQQITRDLSAFREYLLGLGIQVPEEFPPIGISSSPGSTQLRTWGSLPTYRSGATINQGWILDRRAVTEQYADYIIAELLRQRVEQHPSVCTVQDMVASSAIARYYNWSFWDYKAANAIGYWSSQLWAVRGLTGKHFADNLVAFTLKAIIDSPEEDAHPDFDVYFYRKIKIADSVIDGNAEKMEDIKAVIEKNGINVTLPKAYFDFSATAVKRHDGSYAIKAIATNTTNVSAERGHFRMYFAPDVELPRAPKGAQKDSSATLRSARVLPFDSVPAHGVVTMHMEFTPLAKSFAAEHVDSFVLHFEYRCGTCGQDNYAHDLKFTVSAFGPE